ncbi:MAG: DUF11 domain-containing protein [Anaerolineae bacterium]|nr:DUF11 domain-containing protein [Anaerolineae bacterium]
MRNHQVLQVLNQLLLLALLILCCGKDIAAAPGPPQAGELWRDAQAPGKLSPAETARLPRQYRLLTADTSLLRATLDAAPREGAGGIPTTLSLPLPDGGLARFELEAYVMMEPGLAAKFPEFKTYLGRGVDDPTMTVRVSWTSSGLHAAIFDPDGIAFVTPYRDGDVTRYIAYDEQDAAEPGIDETGGGVAPAAPRAPQVDSRSNATRRTYRLAVATTGEYAQAHGGTVTDTLAAVVASINDLNGMYEPELSARFTLIAGNDRIIYTDPATDPFTNDDTSVILNENQDTLNTVIGSANYDVGHVFRSGNSGKATLGTLCQANKARGVSHGGLAMMAHEMGHQFGAHHTHNGYDDCATGEGYEPGSGFTIMSYAGLCGVQSILEPGEGKGIYFHTYSFDEIMDYIILGEGGACPTITEPGNAAPTVEAGPAYTIPRDTPFTLNGSGSDANGDDLTYLWEEFDLGPAPVTSTLPNTDADGNARAIFRSFLPIAGTQRTFPRLSTLLGGAYAWKGESLPTINRVMQFRLTARDGRGGVSYDTTSVTVAASAGPFRITAPRGGLIFLPRGSRQTFTWDVANTAAAPVNCPNVNILLSTDGGNTFPITLTANTPNDGSELVTLPDMDPTGLIFKVACADNIFFDVAPGGLLCTSIFQDDHEGGFSGWTISDSGDITNPWQSMTDGGYSGNNYFYIDTRNKDFTDSRLESDAIPVTSDTSVLVFAHRYEMQLRYNSNDASDGGVVEISVNGGDWADVGEEAFILNGYNHVVATAYSSALIGRPAFSGDSAGYGLSLVDLSGLAQNGDSVRIRFRQSNDGWYAAGGGWGWAVDDVALCHSDPVPALSIQKTVAYARRPIEPGDRVTYTVVVANAGGADAANVHVTDTLPAHVSGTGLDQTVTITARNAITWTLPVSVTMDAPDGQIVNSASYSYPSAEYCLPGGVCSGSAQARFIVNEKFVYLPVVLRQ